MSYIPVLLCVSFCCLFVKISRIHIQIRILYLQVSGKYWHSSGEHWRIDRRRSPARRIQDAHERDRTPCRRHTVRARWNTERGSRYLNAGLEVTASIRSGASAHSTHAEELRRERQSRGNVAPAGKIVLVTRGGRVRRYSDLPTCHKVSSSVQPYCATAREACRSDSRCQPSHFFCKERRKSSRW